MITLEFKAELRDVAMARKICEAIGAEHFVTVDQVDTYYRVTSGRLKKRETTRDGVREPVEYMQYTRADRTAPRLNETHVYGEQEARERFGLRELPVQCVVRKRREEHRLEFVLIHLDEVDGLGWFIEFVAAMSDENDAAACQDAIVHLRKAFDHAMGEPISSGYADLVS
jgi:adenylate cyclase class IV